MSNSSWATSNPATLPFADHALTGYVHPTGDGYHHVPATGTTNANKALIAGATAGSEYWGQYNYTWLSNLPTLGTAAACDVPASGDAGPNQAVLGKDSRMVNARPASDVYTWAKAETKPAYAASEITGLSTAVMATPIGTLPSGSASTPLATDQLSKALANILALIAAGGGGGALGTEYLGSMRGVQALATDSDTTVTWADHGGILLAVSGPGCIINLPAASTWPAGKSVNILNTSGRAASVKCSGSDKINTGGTPVYSTIFAPSSQGGIHRVISDGVSAWYFVVGGTPRARVSTYPGAKTGTSTTQLAQWASHFHKFDDVHPIHPHTKIKAVGGGSLSTSTTAYGRAGAYISGVLGHGAGAGAVVSIRAGSNNGLSTIFAPPGVNGEYATLPGGASGDAAAPTYSNASVSSGISNLFSLTTTATNLSPSVGTPIGQGGVVPNITRGFGGGSAPRFTGYTGQQGAGPGAVISKALSHYDPMDCIFSLSVGAAAGALFYDLSPNAAAITKVLGVNHSATQKRYGLNTCYLGGGYLSVNPSAFNFSTKKHVTIVAEWYYVSSALVTDYSVVYDTATSSGSSFGHKLVIHKYGSDVYLIVYAREYYVINVQIDPASIINKFVIISVDIAVGESRSMVRLSVDGVEVGSGVIYTDGLRSTDSVRIGCNNDGSGTYPSYDYCAGFAVYAS